MTNFMLSIDPLSFDSDFQCVSCKAKESNQRAETLIDDYSGEKNQCFCAFIFYYCLCLSFFIISGLSFTAYVVEPYDLG